MFSRPSSVRVLAIAWVVGVALSAAPAPAATPTETKHGQQIFNLINDFRDLHDKAELKKNKCLQRFAVRQARKMAAQKELSHQNSGTVMRSCGLSYYAENVVMGPFTAAQLVGLWIDSSGHLSNILYSKYRITGVAARKADGYWWAAQVFGRK